MAYLVFSLSLLLIYVGLALALHIQFGLLGIPNFGVVGFWGLGMYAMGVFQVQLDLSFVDAIVLSVACVAAASWVIGRLVLRLDAQGILCATIAFSAIVALLIVTEKWMTMGVVGLGTIKYPVRIGGATEYLYFFFLIAVVAALQLFTLRLHKSTTGRLLLAIRDNEEVAASLGKDTYAVKTFWFVITCIAMGLLGALSAPLNQFLTPNMIVPSVTFAVWIALVLGGKEHSLGAVVGVFITFGIFDILIETYAPVTPELAVYVPNFKLFVYGLLLVGVLMFKPVGLLDPGLPPEAVIGKGIEGVRTGVALGRRLVASSVSTAKTTSGTTGKTGSSSSGPDESPAVTATAEPGASAPEADGISQAKDPTPEKPS
ncbi:branched-chain amino acid ABC transporter permease [uncultured Roseibium sp.]|uniref:branched-chain amino acid ABC transporter permease n=1 Tax=uncultured Roseibium sp. TaxID=1936171 RepID=UPI00262599B9|nr:branched-chain amino acid ABC transporter permease [uncultured Roseibium sp.]